jgi:hypothetical protein
MQHNHQTFLTMLHCPYKAWQLSRETSTPDPNAPALPLGATINDKIALAAFYSQDPEIQLSDRDRKSCSTYSGQARALLTTTENVLSRPEAPSFFKIAHCSECKYKKSCYQKLKERDCISLLAGMTPKVIDKYRKKGITTITQLSHLFRPRRRSRSLHVTGRYLFELKALAIRERKTFVLHPPDTAITPTSIYLDFEGLPDSKFHYLLGGIIVSDEQIKDRFSFWSDDEKQEMDYFGQLLNLFRQYPNANIYHYGSYETKALKAAVRLLGGDFAKEWPSIEKRMINLLSYLRTHVYPPTYSNGLKEVGSFLGFQWGDPQADGLQSISWREQWEKTHSESLKQKLVEYNLDDCEALRRVHQWFCQLAAGADQEGVQQVSNMKKHSPYRLRANVEFGEDFQIINKAAYFDYQRAKIYWRNQPKSKTPAANKPTRKSKRQRKGAIARRTKKVNEVVIRPTLDECPHCRSRKLHHFPILKDSFKQIDLKFTASGIRRHVVQYRLPVSDCTACGRRLAIRHSRLYYGDTFFAMVVNYYVNYHLSNDMICKLLQEEYGIIVGRSYLVTARNAWWDRTWEPVADYIREIVLHSPVIHIDETTIPLKGQSGYVWVFATTHSVFYHYTPTRNSEFLRELLKGYKGIVVSDFYPGYETLEVTRQKCLIHLIRDLNDDLFKVPFDEEYRSMVSAFGKLLRGMIETIDRHGLQKAYLEKHRADAERFYQTFIEGNPTSELSVRYSKRLKKHWSELWTFLHHDGVPWNNNNAEVAIKAFAQHRHGVKGMMREDGLREYLQMLSVAQTCRYRNLSFLQLLRRKCGLWENISYDALPGYLPFSQARLFVQRLGFKGKRDWSAWSKEGNRPSFIPSDPHLIYKNKGWTNWQDWIY